MTDRGRCPTCKGPRALPPENQSHPFCSGRCKLADLAGWLDGKYAIPTDEIVDPEDFAALSDRRTN